MQTPRKSPDSAAPRLQQNWDWRAAANFIAGGAGGGLLLCAALSNIQAPATKAAVLLGLALIGIGLTCVWFEIGRPWRALNVYRHFAGSWMTREAVAAALLFVTGGVAFLTGRPLFLGLTGILGLLFVCCQAGMLWANKGIPAWRHKRSLPLLIITDVAEGAGFLACVLSIADTSAGPWPPTILLALVVIRYIFWKRYLASLALDGAPEATLEILCVMDSKFALLGHLLPALAVIGSWANLPGKAGLMFGAGAGVALSGWIFKFYLIRRAAYTQGLALAHLPARGRGGEPGPAVRPGWKTVPGGRWITGER